MNQETGDEVRRFKGAAGEDLAYAEYGARDGTPSLFIHGCLGSRISAEPFHAAALEQDIRLIAIDKPGFGHSAPQPEFTLRKWAELIAEFTRHLRLAEVDIVTSSGGTPYALGCASYIPDRVRSVVLINPILDVLAIRATGRRRPHRSVMNAIIRNFPRMTLGVLDLGRFIFSRKPDLVIRALHHREIPFLERDQTIYRNRKRTIEEALRQGCRGLQSELQLYARPWDMDLGAIRTKTIVIQGLLDPSKEVSDYYNRALPNSRLITFPDEDHLSLSYNQMESIFCLLTKGRGVKQPIG